MKSFFGFCHKKMHLFAGHKSITFFTQKKKTLAFVILIWSHFLAFTVYNIRKLYCSVAQSKFAQILTRNV